MAPRWRRDLSDPATLPILVRGSPGLGPGGPARLACRHRASKAPPTPPFDPPRPGGSRRSKRLPKRQERRIASKKMGDPLLFPLRPLRPLRPPPKRPRRRGGSCLTRIPIQAGGRDTPLLPPRIGRVQPAGVSGGGASLYCGHPNCDDPVVLRPFGGP